MLEEILDYIHNYFINKVYKGHFKIESGSLVVDFLQNGQYYKVVGSVFNDGIHKYIEGDAELIAEEFDGEIWALAIPKVILDLATEIKAWDEEYGATINSPYQSESFGGYSYTKSSGGRGGNGSGQLTWRDKFGAKLNAYRKIS